MKLTRKWLEEFVDIPDLTAEELRDIFESLGHEVEEMREVTPTFTGVVVGKVLEVGPHPNADRIRLCLVDVGSDEPSEIVCGAWNFEAGAHVPVAVPGAVLQGNFEIGRRKLRGVLSNGMICSEAELEVGEDADGIMVLDTSYPRSLEMIGGDFADLLDLPDVFYDISVTPNRPDCMSVLGLARELAAYLQTGLRVPDITLASSGAASAVRVEIEDAEACPRFASREVRDVVVGPSPHWMRRRLALAGVRPISNVVDASNYAMLEMGHPTHAFDLDRLGSSIVVRRAREGESITTLDDVERDLVTSDIVVADGDNAVAIAGIMGGASTEVGENTTSLLIEAAYWDPPSIMLTSKRLGLRSEASARFERGMDPEFCQLAADRVAQILVEIAGATAVDGPPDSYPGRADPGRISFPISEVRRHLGIDLEPAMVRGLLERLGFGVSGSDPLEVTVPSRRPDVGRTVDLVEEVARLIGFDAIPDRVATGPGGGLPALEANLRRLRSVLAGAGYHEAMTFSFIGDGDLDALGLAADDARRDGIAVLNPLRDEEGVMRTTLLPGLLKAAAVNEARKLPGASLFETGKVFHRGPADIPDQPDNIAFISTGERGADFETKGRDPDPRDAVGVWDLIAFAMRVPRPSVRSASSAPFHPSRGAEVLSDGEVIGMIGQIHPGVAAAFGLSGVVIAGEISLEPLVRERAPWAFEPPSVFPPVIFDLAFEVEEGVASGAILDAIASEDEGLIEERSVFDVFRGDPIAEGSKSVAVRLSLRAPDRTLTDEEVAPIRRRIVAAVEAATGASLRGEA